jgi:GNAT superfamily N-acetyltransferase
VTIQISTLKSDRIFDSVPAEVVEIFYESSVRKTFSSSEEKRAFEFKYLGWYLHRLDTFFIAKSNNRIIGYLAGSIDTPASYLDLHPYLYSFKEQFQIYPAHLHINLHHEARGKGVGTLLISAFETMLRESRAHGVHLITSPKSRNVSFYEKNGFHRAKTSEVNGSELLMFAKNLSGPKNA